MKITRWINKTVILLSAIYLTSCATSIKQSEIVLPYQMENSNGKASSMDFIGFKCDPYSLSDANDTDMTAREQWTAIEQTSSFRNLGNTLQYANIARDKSFSYLKKYSLQELELYKSDSRYITFIEVTRNNFTIADNKISKTVTGILGAALLTEGISCHYLSGLYNETPELKSTYNTLGIFCDIASAGLFISALTGTKTKSTLNCLYNIYVYDTQKKEIIHKEPVSVFKTTEFKGSYSYDEQSKNTVHEYYGKLIVKEILRKYDEISLMFY